MKLQTRQRIGPYEITQLLGRGGMGEVWGARDTSLDREVALKFLPAHLRGDRERTLRFEREAKLLASLSHPNLAGIYGFEQQPDYSFLVLEHVEGETLADRLKRGGLPVEDALDIARQVAEGIEAAHAQGVIHRDLKPGNIMVRADGTVKVLDFGLARALDPDVPTRSSETSSDSPTVVAHSPTITSEHTNPGIILGTAPYMSPEQARGRALDKRTDIWSFGVILFECLTGQMLFRGDNPTDSMGAIMHRIPQWGDLPTDLPDRVMWLLKRCLAKDRKERLHDIADARIELAEAIRHPQPAAAPAATPVASTRWWPLALGLLLGGLLAWAGLRWQSPDEEPGALRRMRLMPEMSVEHGAIAPDGSSIAFSVGSTLYMRQLDTFAPRVLWEAEQPIQQVFWAPDGSEVGVQVDKDVRRISVSTGQAMLVGTVSVSGFSLRWGADGFIYAPDALGGRVQRMSVREGVSEDAIPIQEGVLHYHGVFPLSGGRLLAVPHYSDARAANDIVLVMPDGTHRTLLKTEHEVADLWYTNGYLVFSRMLNPAGVWAVRCDLDAAKVEERPVQILPAQHRLSFSDKGDMAFAARDASRGGRQLVRRTFEGEVVQRYRPLLSLASGIALSPDGTSVALSAMTEGDEYMADIWVVDLVRETGTRLAAESGMQVGPRWTADGRTIYYSTIDDGMQLSVQRRLADGDGASETLPFAGLIADFSPDEQQLLVTVGSPMRDLKIATVPVDGTTEDVVNLVDSAGWDTFAELRPQGDLLLYQSSDAGVFYDAQVYVRRFPRDAGRWLVSSMRVVRGIWSHDGEAILLLTRQGTQSTVWKVPVKVQEDDVLFGQEQRLFQLTLPVAQEASMAVMPDGEHLLLVEPIEVTESAENRGMILIQNWIHELN